MNTNRRWIMISIAAATLLLMLVSSIPVQAEDYQCTGSLGAIAVDNVIVPPNSACTLNGTVVNGNISVRTNAALYAYNVRVNNDVQADKAARVNIYTGSFIGGNLQIAHSGVADIQSVDIHNNLVFNENNRSLNALDNTIGGNLQATKNTGGVSIDNNTIGGNLQCKENVPAPTGAGNIVSGNMEDQCADFGAVPIPTPTNTRQSPTDIPQAPTETQGIPTNTPPAATQTPVVDREAPTVKWAAPIHPGERYDLRDGEQIYLEAEASDNESIEQVKFFRWDAVNLHYVTIMILDHAPFRINLKADTLNPEWNQVFVIASDQAGNQSDYPFIWLYKLVEEKLNNLTFLPVIGN